MPIGHARILLYVVWKSYFEREIEGDGRKEGDVSVYMQERTPGVGREEEEEEGGEGGEDGGEREKERQAEVEEVRRKIQQLEARIEEAVSEEVEDYELAGEPPSLSLCLVSIEIFSSLPLPSLFSPPFLLHTAELDKELSTLREKLTSLATS